MAISAQGRCLNLFAHVEMPTLPGTRRVNPPAKMSQSSRARRGRTQLWHPSPTVNIRDKERPRVGLQPLTAASTFPLTRTFQSVRDGKLPSHRSTDGSFAGSVNKRNRSRVIRTRLYITSDNRISPKQWMLIPKNPLFSFAKPQCCDCQIFAGHRPTTYSPSSTWPSSNPRTRYHRTKISTQR